MRITHVGNDRYDEDVDLVDRLRYGQEMLEAGHIPAIKPTILFTPDPSPIREYSHDLKVTYRDLTNHMLARGKEAFKGLWRGYLQRIERAELGYAIYEYEPKRIIVNQRSEHFRAAEPPQHVLDIESATYKRRKKYTGSQIAQALDEICSFPIEFEISSGSTARWELREKGEMKRVHLVIENRVEYEGNGTITSSNYKQRIVLE